MARSGRSFPSRRNVYRLLNSGIVFDAASNSGYKSAAAEPDGIYSWSHTTAGANRYLVVGISMLSVAGSSVTGITYAGVSLTKIGHVASVTGAVRAELWGLIAPALGTNTIEVTLSAALDSLGTAVSLIGVHQTQPTEGFNSATATNVGAADATVDITTLTDNDWVIDQVATDDTAITVGAGQTQRNNVSGALGSGADSTEGPKTPAGSVTMSWSSVAGLATWSIVGVGIRNIYGPFAQTLTPDPIAIPVVLPSVAVSLGALTLTPDPVAIPLVLPDPTISHALTIAPSPVIIPIALPDPAVSFGAITISPDPIILPVLLPSVTVSPVLTITPDPIQVPIVLTDPVVSSVLALTPDPIIIPIVLPDPALSLAVSLAPDPISVPITLPDPAISLGALTLTPDPIQIPIVIPDPVVASALSITPDPVTIPIILPDLTLSLTLSLTPDPIVIPILLPSISIEAIQTITPDPILIPIVLTDPTITATISLTPDPIAIPLVIPDPAISLGAITVTPDPISIPILLTAPSVSLGAQTITPDPITVPIILPAPSIAATLALTPDPIQIPLVLPTPSVSAALTLVPDPIVIPIVLPDPVVASALTLTPDPIAIPLLLPDPTVSQTGAQAISPTPVIIPIVLPSISIFITPVPPVPPAPSTGDGSLTPSGGWARVLASIRNPLPLNWWQLWPWKVQPQVQPVEIQVIVYRHQVISYSGLSPQSHLQPPITIAYPAAIKAVVEVGFKSVINSPTLSVIYPSLHTKAAYPISILQPPTASLFSSPLIVWTDKQYRDDLDDLVALGILDPDDRDRELLELVGRH